MADRRITIYLLLIGCLLFGVFTGRPFFFNLAWLLGLMLLAALVWSWFAGRWLRINRQTRSRRGQVGRLLDEQFTVTNSGLIPKLWVEIRDFSTLPAHAASRVVPALLPFRAYSWTVHTRCMVRGEFTLGPITLTTGDPFGLFQTTRHIAATTRVLIYPMTVPLVSFVPALGSLSGGDARRQRAPYVTTNASGIRQYAPGDSLSRVHWKSSARQDRLMVKEFELDPMADTWVLVDLSARSFTERPYTISGTEEPEFIPPSSEEYAVVVASSVAQYFLDKERTAGLLIYAPQRTLVAPERGYRQQNRILETLAMAKRQDALTLREVLALEDQHFSRGDTLVIVTADMNTDWVGAAQLVARRGLRVAAILLDPVSFGGEGDVNAMSLSLAAGGVVSYIVRNGEPISAALAVPSLWVR